MREHGKAASIIAEFSATRVEWRFLFGGNMSDEPKQPYYIPTKHSEQKSILRVVAELVKKLGEAAPKIDHTCKVVKKE